MEKHGKRHLKDTITEIQKWMFFKQNDPVSFLKNIVCNIKRKGKSLIHQLVTVHKSNLNLDFKSKL